VAGDPTELPRIQVVFSLWQCDKQNHGCPGGATDRLLPKLRSGGPAFTLRQSQFRTKKEYCFALVAASSSLTTLAGIKRLTGKIIKPVFTPFLPTTADRCVFRCFLPPGPSRSALVPRGLEGGPMGSLLVRTFATGAMFPSSIEDEQLMTDLFII
jgi:hypothetical protein